MVLFNSELRLREGVSYFSQEYASGSQNYSATAVWSHLRQGCSPTRYLLPDGNFPSLSFIFMHRNGKINVKIVLFCFFCCFFFCFFFFCKLTKNLVFWSGFGNEFVFQNPWKFMFPFHFIQHYRAFHISVSRCIFTGVWVTASLHKSPGLFSVFWPFSIMLSFGWSPPVRQLPSLPVPLVIL